MMHAEFLADFYHDLLDRGVPAEVAGPLTIQTNEAVCNGTLVLPGPSRQDQEQAIAEAAAARAARRAEELS